MRASSLWLMVGLVVCWGCGGEAGIKGGAGGTEGEHVGAEGGPLLSAEATSADGKVRVGIGVAKSRVKGGEAVPLTVTIENASGQSITVLKPGADWYFDQSEGVK